ncbi:PAS domain-containing protein [Microvirga sp. BT689]|uniref:sensor histidine kinase n=1 Tax=Microvirga arvi TaxID=2778731 RepID=UPI0019505CDA|nr:histidine kinase dimerization/phosphoacceptor domain -containing protein [Microvirga arvi]MBM6583799.1 PAS domain-containing protein [Microvirga arvi]
MNEFQEDMADTAGRTVTERHIDAIRQQGGLFVEAVRRTRMPMLVTDATLPGNPIVFANQAFVDLSGYSMDELLGQDPHFMNGVGTEPEAIRRYQAAIKEGRDETLEILQYRKDGTPFRAMLFASPVDDGQGTVTNHFLSYLDITRRFDAEENLRSLASELENRVAARTGELEAANARLSALVTEREMLLVEVNHRAKNSLAIAASLLGIQGRRQPDPAVRALFEEAQDRLNAMARVHDLLSKSERGQHVDVSMYVADLCEALRPITGDGDRVSLKADIDQGILVDADTAVPLGIVLTELITNAVKYAFPAPRSGTILVRALRVQSGWVELMVRDDGVGMSSLREGSLGYGLVRSLVQQIRGEIDVRNDAGLVVTISFPEAPQQSA